MKAGITTETVARLSHPGRSAELGLADAVEQVLEELAVAGHEVGHDPPLQGLEAEDQQEHGQDGGLQVAADVAQGPEVRVARAEQEAREESTEPRSTKTFSGSYIA